MKNWIAAFLFLVQWQEYSLKTTQPCQKMCDSGDCWPCLNGCVDGDTYTVETVDKSIKLKTQKDVDLFVTGFERDKGKGFNEQHQAKHTVWIGGLLPTHAFNIQVKEIGESK
jgi:hypothetical protein